MYCSNCGNKLVDGAKFCNSCGVAVVDNTERKEERTSTFEGEIHKCPNCGDIIDAYETVCEACGYELRGRKAVSLVQELAKKIEDTDDATKKEELIRNFYIPNTKEDINEFFILAISNIESGGDDVGAWLAKLEQAYQKARLTLNNTAEFSYLEQLYKRATKGKTVKALGRAIVKSTLLKGVILAMTGVTMMIIGNFSSRFYMFGMLGYLLLMLAVLIIFKSKRNDGKKDDK